MVGRQAGTTPLIDQVCVGCRLRESASKPSGVKIKSGLFAKITTTDTEARPKIKNLQIQEIPILELRHEGT